MDVLPALRDAEGDLAAWRRSPLRPLIEDAFAGIDRDELAAVGDQIAQATAAMAGFEEVQSLETRMAELFRAMSGPKQDVQPRSEERRVGKGWVRTCRSGGGP